MAEVSDLRNQIVTLKYGMEIRKYHVPGVLLNAEVYPLKDIVELLVEYQGLELSTRKELSTRVMLTKKAK